MFFTKKREVPFVGMTGWAVNSIASAVKGSSPFLPILAVFNSVSNVIIFSYKKPL